MGRNVRNNDADDYIKASLPKFGIWAGFNATAATAPSAYGLLAYDSDFSFISGTTQTTYPGLATTAGTLNALAFKTNTNLGTGTVTADGWAKATGAQSYDGHTMISAAVDGAYAFRSRSLMSAVNIYFGAVVGPEGFRSNVALFQRGNTMQLGQYASGTTVPLDTVTLDGTMMTLFSLVAGSLGTNASIGYNRNTNTLVVIEGKDTLSQAARAHIWRNPRVKLSGRPGQLLAFIRGAAAGSISGQSYRFVDFAWQNAPGSNAEHNRYRVYPCNNGAIALARQTISTGHDLGIIGTDNVFQQRQSGVTSTGTTYGAGDAVDYGARHNVTWDNKWALAYSAYTSYGCGLIGYLINLDDPTLNYNVTVPITSDGTQVVPFGRSGFLVNDSSVLSGSGVGPTVAVLDASQGFTPAGVQLVNQGAYPLVFTRGVMDVPYAVTNYPLLVPIERWAAPGVLNGPL